MGAHDLSNGEFILGVTLCAYYAMAVILIALCAFAPEGWEDERGYHDGRKPGQ